MKTASLEREELKMDTAEEKRGNADKAECGAQEVQQGVQNEPGPDERGVREREGLAVAAPRSYADVVAPAATVPRWARVADDHLARTPKKIFLSAAHGAFDTDKVAVF